MSGVTLIALEIGESHQSFLRQYIVIALADDGFSGAADELLGIFRSEKIRRFDEDVTGFTPQLIADDRADIIVEIVRIVEVGENDEDGVVCGEDRGEIITKIDRRTRAVVEPAVEDNETNRGSVYLGAERERNTQHKLTSVG